MKTNSLKPTPSSKFNVRCARFTLTPATPRAAPRSPLGFLLSVFCFLLFLGSASAATRYVCQTSPSPGPPYDTWANAAHDIQTAVDAALAGDEIVVTNGLYATGGRAVGTNLLVNRVAVDEPLTLRSVNGPEVTIIQGAKAPGGGNGDGAIRCVYLAEGASLSRFTLTNGATRATYDYPTYQESGGGGVWCESTNAVVSNCVLTGNSALIGGGAYGGTLCNCTLTGNSAPSGGGTFYGTLNNCSLAGNLASWGGGALEGALYNCSLTGNSASYGGGTFYGTLNNCTLTCNSAEFGGGARVSTLNNCIVYCNVASVSEDNYSGGTLNYCCTTPMPLDGAGNISEDPQLASATYLSATSPCRGGGNAAYASGTDIDGEAWLTPPSIGCDEYYPDAAAGPLSVSIAALYTNAAAGCEVGFTAVIDGHASLSVWDFGDGTVVSNPPYATHAWAALGDYALVLRAYNDSHPDGVSATVAVHVVAQPVHYVAAESPNPVPPYTSWATAATNVQDAVDAAAVPGSLVLVSNGIYASGGRDGSRVVVEKPLTLRSLNGSEVTVIEGEGGGELWPTAATRCAFLVSRATLSGFTLTNGSAGGGSGGGVLGGTLVNCRLTKNAAWEGGGACASTLRNCILSSNRAEFYGGGAHECTLDNCLLVGNTLGSWAASAPIYGAGAAFSTLNNCTLTGNKAADRGGGAAWSVLNNCTLTGNSSYSDGGGAIGGTLNNCTLTGNVCGGAGGGAAWSALNNCTMSGNSSDGYGGGAYEGTLNNCIVYFNTAPYGQNCGAATLNYCCTTPLSATGLGNIDADPLFVDYAGGDLRLRPDSPCINAGNNACVTTPTDLDGMPRILGGTVDMGAYEYNFNRSPVADAGATRPLWISPNGLSANVVLDGSRSSDPDGDLLQYLWLSTLNPQPSTVLASGLVAVVRLPVGVHPILLVVSDGLAAATNTITIQVITPAQAVQRLIAQVESSWRRSQPLLASLSAALRSIERGNQVSALNQLRAFQNKLRAQVAPSSPALAARFLQTAQEIIDALSGGQTNPGGRPHGRLTATRHPANGHVQLQLMAEPGAVRILEASTDLVRWEKIGIAHERGDGTFTFDDPNAAQFPNRFYRVVSP